jgi:hypothetical protein
MYTNKIMCSYGQRAQVALNLEWHFNWKKYGAITTLKNYNFAQLGQGLKM